MKKNLLLFIGILVLLTGCGKKPNFQFNIELKNTETTSWTYDNYDKNIVSLEKNESNYIVSALKKGNTIISFRETDKNGLLNEYIIYKINVDKDLNISYDYEKSVDKISLGKENWVKQKSKIQITDKDYMVITDEVVMKTPDGCTSQTCNFSINIPYILYIDDETYNGFYILGNNERQNDLNPKYNITITNLTKEGYTKIIIENK